MRERRSITVRGIVQGVGFRPFVYGLASRLGISGFVRNQTGGVLIEVEGMVPILNRFLDELIAHQPPLAKIYQLVCERQVPHGDGPFRIEASSLDMPGSILVSPDVATCDECLRELFDPMNRRFRYPFLNCTNCGPRLTIVTGAPYDRERTTMAPFVMCDACRAEYADPTNRRFHAQPTACPVCGPQLQILDDRGKPIETDDPLDRFVSKLRAGRIGAMKGLGGYHLICDAHSDAIVGELRRRKHRDEKPFAIMVRDIQAAAALCELSCAEQAMLLSSRRPIVLLRKRPSGHIAECVAPGISTLGVMLPYTPLHHLLLHKMADTPLVMTSGNRSDEPIAYIDHDAVTRLTRIADVFLTHNRPIHIRCDDSVTRVVDGAESPVRLSRGYAPQPFELPFECPHPILAVGGQFKGTFALGRERQALLSHHLGDLDHFAAYRAFVQDIELYQQLFAIEPVQIAHDLHPDYASTRYALDRARQETVLPPWNVPLVPVQHHHAHMASCMAEHGLSERVIGVTFDGTGYGTDGAIWGGEFLVGDYRQFRRAAHLRYVGMPGGNLAIREPWRMALAGLRDAGLPPLPRWGREAECAGSVSASAVHIVEQILDKRLNAPWTSSAGRLFDAVAALAGVRDRVSYEGQAAMELECLATCVAPNGTYPFDLGETPEGDPPWAVTVVDTRPLIRAVAQDAVHGVAAMHIARRFHSTLVELIAAVCGHIRKATALDVVVLSGGVFMNALLAHEANTRLSNDGFRVYRHHLVPPNDAGLSLGQLAVAAAQSGFQESRLETNPNNHIE